MHRYTYIHTVDRHPLYVDTIRLHRSSQGKHDQTSTRMAMDKEKWVNLQKRRLLCCSELKKCVRAAFRMSGSRRTF